MQSRGLDILEKSYSDQDHDYVDDTRQFDEVMFLFSPYLVSVRKIGVRSRIRMLDPLVNNFPRLGCPCGVFILSGFVKDVCRHGSWAKASSVAIDRPENEANALPNLVGTFSCSKAISSISRETFKTAQELSCKIDLRDS